MAKKISEATPIVSLAATDVIPVERIGEAVAYNATPEDIKDYVTAGLTPASIGAEPTLPSGTVGDVLALGAGNTRVWTSASAPGAHAATHATAGSDPIAPADIGAATSTHNHTGVYQPVVSGVSSTEIGYLDGVTSAIQTQFNGKSATTHDHASTYAPIAKGVTNGDTHNHSGEGDGGAISYADLSDVPTTFAPAAHNQSVTTISGTIAQFNSACSDADFATTAIATASANGLMSATDKIKAGRYYDAVAQGGVDNTGATSVNADFEAIQTAATDGDIIYVPSGIYKLTEQFVMDKRLTWVFAGYNDYDAYGTDRNIIGSDPSRSDSAATPKLTIDDVGLDEGTVFYLDPTGFGYSSNGYGTYFSAIKVIASGARFLGGLEFFASQPDPAEATFNYIYPYATTYSPNITPYAIEVRPASSTDPLDLNSGRFYCESVMIRNLSHGIFVDNGQFTKFGVVRGQPIYCGIFTKSVYHMPYFDDVQFHPAWSNNAAIREFQLENTLSVIDEGSDGLVFNILFSLGHKCTLVQRPLLVTGGLDDLGNVDTNYDHVGAATHTVGPTAVDGKRSWIIIHNLFADSQSSGVLLEGWSAQSAVGHLLDVKYLMHSVSGDGNRPGRTIEINQYNESCNINVHHLSPGGGAGCEHVKVTGTANNVKIESGILTNYGLNTSGGTFYAVNCGTGNIVSLGSEVIVAGSNKFTGSGAVNLGVAYVNGSTIPIAKLASGTPDGTKFIRDDGVLAVPASATIADGDKGDITVSSSGTVWTIDNDTIGLDELSATGTPSTSTYLRGDNSWQTITAAPGGITTQIQYNNGGTLAGIPQLTYTPGATAANTLNFYRDDATLPNASRYSAFNGYNYSTTASPAAGAEINGISSIASYGGSGTAPSVVGIFGTGRSQATNNTITQAVGILADVRTSSGTIVNAYDIKCDPSIITGTGVITNSYGVYVAARSGTNKYAIKTVGTADIISFAGNTVVGNGGTDASGNLATTAVDGFLYIPTIADTPTGVPTPYTGHAAVAVGTDALYFYNGSWKQLYQQLHHTINKTSTGQTVTIGTINDVNANVTVPSADATNLGQEIMISNISASAINAATSGQLIVGGGRADNATYIVPAYTTITLRCCYYRDTTYHWYVV